MAVLLRSFIGNYSAASSAFFGIAGVNSFREEAIFLTLGSPIGFLARGVSRAVVGFAAASLEFIVILGLEVIILGLKGKRSRI